MVFMMFNWNSRFNHKCAKRGVKRIRAANNFSKKWEGLESGLVEVDKSGAGGGDRGFDKYCQMLPYCQRENCDEEYLSQRGFGQFRRSGGGRRRIRQRKRVFCRFDQAATAGSD